MKTAAAPTLELNKPMTAKERIRAESQEAMQRAAMKADAAKVETTAKGKGNVSFIGRAWAALTQKPDRSLEGLQKAANEAVKEIVAIKWVSANDMCEEIETLVMTKLGVDHGVSVRFVGCHEDDMTARLLIRTVWGWRIAIRGVTKFGAWPSPSRD